MRAGFSVPVIAPDGSAPSLPASRAAPVSAEEKSSSIWVFCCLSSLRLMAYWPLLLVRAFGHRFRLGLSIAPPFGIRSASLALPTSRPNMPSADFCPAVKPPFDSLSRRSGTEQIPWGKHSRLPCTVAGSTFCTFDGYGLRGKLPARPALTPPIRFLSIDSHVCSTLLSDLASRPHAPPFYSTLSPLPRWGGASSPPPP